VISNGFASMGIALPGMIAALIRGSKGRRAVSGGFGPSGEAIGAGIVVVIWRDNGYGLIDWKQRNAFGRPFGVEFDNPDFVAFAESFGIPGFRPVTADQLYPMLMRALELPGPSVIDVPIDYAENLRLTERLGALAGLV
jgi:acetolactate synthase-1/2/3 large subunit